jgi:hypothetical protein
MLPDVERTRQELEHAREMSERLWAEYRAYAETLDPARGVAGPKNCDEWWRHQIGHEK